MNHDSTFMTKEKSTIIKGGLALCILGHHILEFVSNSDEIYPVHIGYLLVAAFFWISGYGVRKSLLRKQQYLDGFLAKSISKLYLPFLVVSAIYIGVRYCFGVTYSAKMILTSMIGIKTIASFSWFVFEIIALYIVFYIAFIVSKNHGEILVFFTTLVFIWFAYQKEMDTYWYVSTLAFPFGMLVASKEQLFEQRIFQSKKICIICIASLIVTTIGASEGMLGKVLTGDHTIEVISNISAITASLLACMAIGFLSMHMSEKNNRLLTFWGQNSYELYLMQGLFVRGFKEIVIISNDFLYAAIVIIFSLGAALLLKPLLQNTTEKVQQFVYR